MNVYRIRKTRDTNSKDPDTVKTEVLILFYVVSELMLSMRDFKRLLKDEDLTESMIKTVDDFSEKIKVIRHHTTVEFTKADLEKSQGI